jgi:hypothetical protein
MSETAGASAGAGAAASTGAASESASVTPSQSTNESQQSSGNAEATENKTTASKATDNNAETDFEEIKVGSVTGKVPKQIAAMIKNLERGFQSKAQEAASKEKLLSLAKENPKEFYKQTGKDVYEFAEEVLAEKYELMNMDPRDRELKEYKQKEAERNAAENASKQEVIEALKQFGPIPEGAEKASKEELIQYYKHQQKVHAQTQVQLDQELGNAFKESGLSPDRHLLAKVAFEMRSALAKNKSLSAKDAVAKVTNEYNDGMKLTVSKMEAKKIHELFGDEFLDKIRKYDLDQVTANAASKFGQSNNSPGQRSASESPKKEVNQFEWRKVMGIE